ncbi:helveticin [Lactobacillus crispatus]|uniref:hypothetical protein n=1 Tax=Lactobacillus crispatus TaxID=47770 RepID=UPI0018E34903|nr:hypothetical protein [Lactobacillus crispatus]MBI1722243.1 helveticin [Lactobacillus crispatus]
MTVSDYIQLGFLLSWIFCLVGLSILAHVHFKNQKAEKYRLAALNAMKKWVAYYDKQDMDNPEKANGALNDAVKELNSKGYKVTDQQARDLEALREWVLAQLRMKQAQSGVEDAGIAKDVPADDIISPVDQLPKIDAPAATTEGDSNDK